MRRRVGSERECVSRFSAMCFPKPTLVDIRPAAPTCQHTLANRCWQYGAAGLSMRRGSVSKEAGMSNSATRSIAGPDDLPASTDVLIAGAGPSGLALAAALRRRGIAPVIVDRHPAGANTSRACVVHA